MKFNPFEISKIVNKAMKNKDRIQARMEELRAKPLEVTVGNATVTYDLDQNRISQIKVNGINENELENIRLAVNQVFDKADGIWTEFET